MKQICSLLISSVLANIKQPSDYYTYSNENQIHLVQSPGSKEKN